MPRTKVVTNQRNRKKKPARVAAKPRNGAKAVPSQWPPWALQLLAVDDNLHTLTDQLDVAADAAALNDC